MIYVYKDEKSKDSFYFQIILKDLETGKQKKIKRRGFSSEKEANKAAMLFVSDKKNYEYNGLKFDFIIEKLICYMRERIDSRSIQRYEREINTYILPYITGKYINRFSVLDADDFYTYVLRLNKSASQTNLILDLFKRIFKFAQKKYHIDFDPTIGFDRMKKVYKPIDPLDLYTPNDFYKFIQYFDESSIYEMSFKLFFIVLFYTGVRRGECKAIKWNDIDFENQILRIDEQAIDKDPNFQFIITDKLKNPQSHRKIPIENKTLELLIRLKDRIIREEVFDFDDLVFRRLNSGKPFADSTIDNRNRKAAKNANIKRIKVHFFRHSFGSNMLSHGAPLTAVSEVMGHSNIGITQKVYIHAINRDKEKLFETLNELKYED